MLALIGSGPMAREYAKVLGALDCEYLVVARGDKNASSFEAEFGQPVIRGGLEKAIADGHLIGCDQAIVSVGVEGLADATVRLIESGIKKILVEKPAGLCLSETLNVETHAKSHGAKVYVAYNRRFYASVMHARRLIEEDGGVESFTFEFTEWGHVIEKLAKANGVKERWVLGNSTHVIDLAFFLCGNPVELTSMHSGGLDWHPNASKFYGCGKTKAGALFSYSADWDAPGRWGVEVMSSERRFILRPLEALQVMRRGSVSIDPVEIDDSKDKIFKPGVYQQVAGFLGDNGVSRLCSLEEHAGISPTYERIAGYDRL